MKHFLGITILLLFPVISFASGYADGQLIVLGGSGGGGGTATVDDGVTNNIAPWSGSNTWSILSSPGQTRIYVGGTKSSDSNDGFSPYTAKATVQAALTLSTNYSNVSIFVAPGVYNEVLTFAHPGSPGTGVMLIGDGYYSTKINVSTNTSALTVTAGFLGVRGIEIKNSDTNSNANACLLSGGTLTILPGAHISRTSPTAFTFKRTAGVGRIMPGALITAPSGYPAFDGSLTVFDSFGEVVSLGSTTNRYWASYGSGLGMQWLDIGNMNGMPITNTPSVYVNGTNIVEGIRPIPPANGFLYMDTASGTNIYPTNATATFTVLTNVIGDVTESCTNYWDATANKLYWSANGKTLFLDFN